jgi:hypothetical protein
MDAFFEPLISAANALQIEAQAYPGGVRTWMAAMAILFFGGIVFVPWRNDARAVVGVMAITALALIVGKAFWPQTARAQIGATIHLVLWTPLLVFLLRNRFALFRPSIGASGTFARLHRFWLYAVIAVLAISIVLDAWALARLL